jgi:tetratricopeptide (TPR) repeat protein
VDHLVDAAAPRRLRRISCAAMIAILLWSAACDPPAATSGGALTHPAPAGERPPTIPDPPIDRAAQKLDGGLGAAWRALNSGQWNESRDLAAAYVRDRGAAAHRGQAEFVTGMTYHRQMLYAEAVEHFLRAMQLEPGFLETYFRAGHALMNMGRLAEARAALAVFARYDADEPAVPFAQGLVEIEDDRAAEAERFLLRAIDLATKKRATAKDPREIDADLGRYEARLGDVYLRRDELQRAKETYARASNLRPDMPEIWSKLAGVCERLGDKAGAESARAKYDEVLKKRPTPGTTPQ